jgi:carbonic anhydrase
MNEYEKLLLQNKAWAKERIELDPDYFNRLAHIQTPQFLWIGCSDSRVPANEVTNTQPGEIFVHRNVANLVVNTDLNLLSVLKYAVEVLKVKHIIVSGHYGCGGVKAAMTNTHFGLLNKWLRNIKDVYRIHSDELDSIVDNEKRTDRLVELNIVEQVYNLAKTSIIQRAWANQNGPVLHGSVYSLENGIMKDLIALDSNSSLPEMYRFEFSDDGVED